MSHQRDESLAQKLISHSAELTASDFAPADVTFLANHIPSSEHLELVLQYQKELAHMKFGAKHFERAFRTVDLSDVEAIFEEAKSAYDKEQTILKLQEELGEQIEALQQRIMEIPSSASTEAIEDKCQNALGKERTDRIMSKMHSLEVVEAVVDNFRELKATGFGDNSIEVLASHSTDPEVIRELARNGANIAAATIGMDKFLKGGTLPEHKEELEQERLEGQKAREQERAKLRKKENKEKVRQKNAGKTLQTKEPHHAGEALNNITKLAFASHRS